jgi:methyl-accepting chemotaxis protein
MASVKNRRRNYLIDRRFQISFALRFCVLVVVSALITGGMVYLLSKETVTTAFIDSRLSIVTTADYLLPLLLISGLVSVVVVGMAAVVAVVYLSHRIAGPLFNISRVLKGIGEGDLSKQVTLRSTDEIQQLADVINQMIGELRQKVSLIKQEAEKIEEGEAKKAVKGALGRFNT